MGEKRKDSMLDAPLRVFCQGQRPSFSPTSAAYTEQGAGLVLLISVPGKAKMGEETGAPLELPLQRHVGTAAFSGHL